MNYTDIIQSVVVSTKCKLYLELGCQFGNTARKMIAANRKVIDVDISRQIGPGDFFFFHQDQESTDQFFSHFNEKPDVIFIDADHKFESVQKDFANSIRVLNEGGSIFLHDTDPENERLLDPQSCNDSYKIVDWIKENYPELTVMVIPADEPGLTIVRRTNDRRIFKFIK